MENVCEHCAAERQEEDEDSAENLEVQLGKAAKAGHEQCIDVLLKAGADVNQATQPPLMFRGYTNDFVNILMAGIDWTNRENKTPLMHASEAGQYGCVELLLTAGADVNQANNKGKTALMIAARSGELEIVKFLLTAGADVNANAVDNEAVTALLHAAELGCNDCVHVLLNAGADVNARGKDGHTTLMYAVRDGFPHYVELVLNYGADVNLNNDKRETAIMHASKSGLLAIVELLLAAGANVNLADDLGQTALMHAAEHGHDKCVEALLKAGADVNAIDSLSESALSHAAHVRCNPFFAEDLNGWIRTVECLIKAGADVNRTDSMGRSPLFYAATSGQDKIMAKLIKAGSKINIKDRSSDNAIQKCMKYLEPEENRKNVVVLLYAAGEIPEDGVELKELDLGEERLSLKHLAREAVRKHLLNVDSHSNLFHRVPHLGLPSEVTEYLVYDLLLDDDDNG